jgi:hypothetical protein
MDDGDAFSLGLGLVPYGWCIAFSVTPLRCAFCR